MPIRTVCFILLYSLYSYSQSSEFLELDADKTWTLKNNYSLNLAASYKVQLNNESKWHKPELNFSVNKKFNPNWSLLGGINNGYTIQNDNPDFYELRPWIGPRLSVPVIPRLTFQQTVKYEVRNFFYVNDDNEPYEIQSRFRYRIHVLFNLAKDVNKPNNWILETGYEWYFLKEPATGEQFSNSREFALNLIKHLKSGKTLSLGYLYERINVNRNPNATDGHTFTLGYSF